MSEDQISEIDSFRNLRDDMKMMQGFKASMPILRPIFKLLNVDVGKMDNALSRVDDLSKTTIEIITLPDRFNDIFSDRGWIAYGLLNAEIFKASVEKAEAGNIDEAETDLVEYYSPETVQWKLRTMRGIKSFRPRMRLAELALVDYRDERYHACIPVVLALIDGLVNELHENHRGFFANDVDLSAWDSIAAHSKGLNVLAEIFKKGRKTTRTEEITIPYRHGIMHGMDLGYDNKMVAAKTWAALFAIRDWALKVERGELTAPPEEPSKSLQETLKELKEWNDEKQLLTQWIPRTIQLGIDAPVSGEPEEYGSGTPEQKLAEFMKYWKARNYGYMANCLHSDTTYSEKELPGVIRERFAAQQLMDFEFLQITDKVPGITVIETAISYEESGRKIQRTVHCRLIHENSEGLQIVRTRPNCWWVLVNWNCFF